MKISAELIKSLMKAIRQQERMDGALKWAPNRSLFMSLIEDNEYYFAAKLKNQDLKKVNYYENKILTEGKNNKYYDLIEEAKNKSQHRELNQLFIDELKSNVTHDEFDFSITEDLGETAIDHLINAAHIYRFCYINFPNANVKNEFSMTVTNAYLEKNNIGNFTLLLSEVINSNIVYFNSSIMDENQFVVMFLKLMAGQIKKNVERIEKTQEVYEKNSIKLNKYGSNIQNYITGNVVFTISDFASVNNISYNTAKKYLKELVIEEILVPIKISKHNAFVYTDVYNIWLK